MSSQPVPESFSLVPDLDEVLVVLDHNVVLVELSVHVRLCSALKKNYKLINVSMCCFIPVMIGFFTVYNF
jgi:hypothetical protein